MSTDVSEVCTASIIRTNIALMMDAVRISETSVNIYFTTRQYIPEGSKLHRTSCVVQRSVQSYSSLHRSKGMHKTINTIRRKRCGWYVPVGNYSNTMLTPFAGEKNQGKLVQSCNIICGVLTSQV
jgi:hypothetical protein